MADDTELSEGRTPQVKMDETVKQQIRDTLERPDVNYNISACAKLLGLNYGRVESFVRRDPVLAAKCPEKDPAKLVPTETDILDREPPKDAAGMLMPRDQAAIMKTLLKQNDRVIRKGWKDVGLSDEDAQAMEDAERRASLPIGRVLAASEGHMISLLARSSQMLDKIGDQLVKGDKSIHGPLPQITDVAGSDKTEVEYLKVYQSGVMTHINLQQVLLKTRAATIEAMQKLKAMQADQKKEAKGVFETNVTPNAAPNNE